jgi:uncharacterized protein
MRLSHTEQIALEYALQGIKGEVYLYGSRTQDDSKGGDIDILIYSSDNSYTLSKKVAVRFFSRCESKIDVMVVSPDKPGNEQMVFIQSLHLVKIK